MSRPRKDGKAHRPTIRVNLTDRYIKAQKPHPTDRTIHYDRDCRGFALQVEHATGSKSYKCKYQHRRRSRTFDLGPVGTFRSVKDARAECFDLLHEVRRGVDPQMNRMVWRTDGTFASHAEEYLREKATTHPKSVAQTRRYLENIAAKWGKLPTVDITRTDVKALFRQTSKRSPSTANQEKAHLSAMFSWLIAEDVITMVNPCAKIMQHKMAERERVLSHDELPLFWKALDDIPPLKARALRFLLLSGQRINECAHLRFEHIERVEVELTDVVKRTMRAAGQVIPEKAVSFIWKMRGAYSKDWDTDTRKGSWCGTKYGASNEVFLPAAMMDLIGDTQGRTGFVFASPTGQPVQGLQKTMKRTISVAMGLAEDDNVTPHDLRRTFSSMITARGHGVDAMHKLLNHREGKLVKTYDRFGYRAERWWVQTDVAGRILSLAMPPPAEKKGFAVVPK